MCQKLCEEGSVTAVTCHAFHAAKGAVFSVTLKNKQTALMKSSQSFEPQDIFYWIDDFGEHYPTEDLFKGMVENRIKMRYECVEIKLKSDYQAIFSTGCVVPVA